MALFHGFETSFQAHELGFSWISKLQFILPEEKPAPNLFETVIQMFQHFDAQFSVPFDLFFRVVTLGYLGLLSPFEKNQESLLALSNGRTPTSAQEVIAFLEQADFETFFEKKKLLPRSKFAEVVRILEQKEKNYF